MPADLLARCASIPVVLAALLLPGGAAVYASPALRQQPDSVELVNDNLRLELSLRCPRFSFNCGQVGGSEAPSAVTGKLTGSAGLKAVYEPIRLTNGALLDVVMHLEWNRQESVLRKWVEYRVSSPPPRTVLHEICLDRLRASSGKPIGFLPSPPQSFPGFFDGFFAGIEFPVASTRLDAGELLLAHRPGKALEGDSGWLKSRVAVYGVAPPGQERETFARFIARHRPKPQRMHFNYNSWWTSPVPFTETDILRLMHSFETNLYRPHGVYLDTFTIDMGWSNPKSVWEIDRKLFPQGFAGIETAAGRMKSRLGVWISPSSCYPDAVDNGKAASEGYETFANPSGQRLCCLGGKKYADAFKNRLVEMALGGARHFKLDGYALECPEATHGHLPGPDSSEAVAEGGLRAIEAVRAVAPDVWLESTCFGFNPSPWWLYSVNSVIGTFGDDSPHGRVPSPFARETATTGRDYYNLQGAALLPLPDTAQEVLGIIHQTDEPFLNDAVTVLLRGHAFVPLYINPKFMTPRRWDQLAALIRWARANEDALAETEPLLPRAWMDGSVPHFSGAGTMPREPYGYLHWNNDRGLLLLRNPWIQKQTVRLDLATVSRLKPDLKDLAAASLYPEPRLYGRNLTSTSVLNVPLAPYETLVVSLAKRLPVKNLPIAAPETSIDIEQLQSGAQRVAYEASDKPAFGADYTALGGAEATAVRVSLEAEVTVKHPSELVVILEGAAKSPAVVQSSLQVDGKQIDWQETHSETLWIATGATPPETWTILKAPLASGKHRVTGSVLASAALKRASAWAWSYREPSSGSQSFPNSLPKPERIYADSAPLLRLQEISTNLPAVKCPREVEKIDGVYLDSLQPVSAVQGWGKLERNRSVWEKPLALSNRVFSRGIGTHASARIVYDLSGQNFRKFQAWAGADAANGAGSLTVAVKVDGRVLFQSGLLTSRDAAARIDVDVTGARELELVVGDGGNGITGDHADFADAKLLR
jgi:hypothetical protein